MKHALLSRVIAGLALMLATAPATVRAEEPLVIHVGYAAIGVDNRPYAEGTSAATARAGSSLATSKAPLNGSTCSTSGKPMALTASRSPRKQSIGAAG